MYLLEILLWTMKLYVNVWGLVENIEKSPGYIILLLSACTNVLVWRSLESISSMSNVLEIAPE